MPVTADHIAMDKDYPGEKTGRVLCFSDSHSSQKEYEQFFQFYLLRQFESLECEVITRGRQVEGSKSPDLNIKRNMTSF